MMKKDTYLIPLAQMPEGEQKYEFHCGKDFFESLDRREMLDCDVNVNLVVKHKNDAYKLLFTLDGNMTVACHRCLDPLTLPVDVEYETSVRYGDEYDDSADGILIIPQDMVKLDVAPIIADTIELSIPMRAVHPEGECNADMERYVTGSMDDIEED